MTRSTAREIAAHLAYELSFTERRFRSFWISSCRTSASRAVASEY